MGDDLFRWIEMEIDQAKSIIRVKKIFLKKL